MKNSSQKKDPRNLAKWKSAGALGTIDDAIPQELGVEIFEKTPLKYVTGTPFYSPTELGKLARKQFPTRIVDRYIPEFKNGFWKSEMAKVWANNLKFSDLETAKTAYEKPTHIIYFSKTSEGNYRFDVKSA